MDAGGRRCARACEVVPWRRAAARHRCCSSSRGRKASFVSPLGRKRREAGREEEERVASRIVGRCKAQRLPLRYATRPVPCLLPATPACARWPPHQPARENGEGEGATGGERRAMLLSVAVSRKSSPAASTSLVRISESCSGVQPACFPPTLRLALAPDSSLRGGQTGSDASPEAPFDPPPAAKCKKGVLAQTPEPKRYLGDSNS
ncbi:hypothetical protein AAT19DRAFT_11468 [Rhodotorula toruloides]|uniref:Uncharacterized protein n=1 Tax=Rhodotorula toruloides TaxID=5286 RepID=A0A2S9ZWV3_RHOTO|nr:hypothetical protein AAT19DRAFT_11468 [Rhodotorula toruloides]